MKESFINNRISIDELPDFQEVSLTRIHKKYFKALLVKGLLWFFTISLVLTYLYLIRVLRSPFLPPLIWMIIIYIFVWGLIFSYLRLSFLKRKFTLRDHDVIYKHGVFSESTVFIPYNRIQHLAIHQGVFSRIYNLASLQFFTAGGSDTDISIKGISYKKAKKMKAFVSKKIENSNSETN